MINGSGEHQSICSPFSCSSLTISVLPFSNLRKKLSPASVMYLQFSSNVLAQHFGPIMLYVHPRSKTLCEEPLPTMFSINDSEVLLLSQKLPNTLEFAMLNTLSRHPTPRLTRLLKSNLLPLHNVDNLLWFECSNVFRVVLSPITL